MYILEESEYLDKEYHTIDFFKTQKKMQLAMMRIYKILRSSYQRIMEFGDWTYVDYGHHAHFFRYRLKE